MKNPATSVTTHFSGISVADRFRQWTVVAFYVMALTVPFFFTWVNEELFEFNKMLLTYGLTAIILALWVGRMIIQKKLLFRRSFMDIPIALFLGSQIISTLLSIHPYTSLFGFYTRFNGGLLSIGCYVALLYAAVNTFTKKEAYFFLRTNLLAGIGVALYTIPEHFGHSPSCLLITGGHSFGVDCWIQDVKNRVYGTFGQPNWLAAYAITLLPVGVALLLEPLARPFQALKNKVSNLHQPGLNRLLRIDHTWFFPWLEIISVLGLTVSFLFTKSRSGLLGLIGGIGVSLVGWAVLARRGQQIQKVVWQRVALVMGGLVIIVALFGTPYTPSLLSVLHLGTSAETNSAPSGGSVLESGGTESGDIRKIVWTGALKIWERYPIFGSGVETFTYSYYQDRPAAHNLVSEWDFLYNKAHNELLQYLSTTGLVGLGSYLIMIATFKFWATKQVWNKKSKVVTSDKIMLIGLVAGLTGLNISNFFGFSTVMVNILMYVFFGVGIIIALDHHELPHIVLPAPARLIAWQKIALVIVGLGCFACIWTVINWWLADYDFAYGKRLLESGQTSAGLDQLLLAIERKPREALFYDELSITYAQLAVAYHQDGEATTSAQLAQAALTASDATMQLNDRHLNFYKNRARVFVTLADINSSEMTKAQETLEKAVTLAPTDAKLIYNLAVVYEALGQTDKAIATLQKTIELKSNYQDAYVELAQIYQEQGKIAAALEQYQTIQRTLAPNDQALATKIATLSAALATQSARKK